MKIAILIAATVGAVVGAVLFWRRPSGMTPDELPGQVTKTPQTFNDILEALETCGLALAKDFASEDFVTSWGSDQLASPNIDLVLVWLGSTEEQPPWRPHCANLWHFDTECIEDHGAYAAIAKRMADMTQGSMPIEEIEDYVDVEASKAWLKFKCRGEKFNISCAVDNDWVDTKVFGHFVRLLAKTEPNKILIYQDLGGQDCIIGCVTREHFDALKRLLPKLQPLS